MVFTLPHELCPLALYRPRVIYDLLFRAANETLATFARDPRFFSGEAGGVLGTTAILHTWGQNLSLHPHLHCVVTGGGLSADGQRFMSPRHKGFLFPVRALAKVFRGKYLDGLRRAFRAGQLGDDGSTKALCDTLRRIDWVVYIKLSLPRFRRHTRTNEFAVGAADGTIRTLFRPEAGANYWKAVTGGL